MMIKKEFDALVEANNKREYALVHESKQKALSEERTYLGYVEKFSKHKTLLEESVKIIEKNTANTSMLVEACVVVLFSDNDILIDRILKLTTSSNYAIPVELVLSRLPEQKQLKVIEKLVAIGNAKSLKFAGICMIANGYNQFVKYFYKNGNIVDTEDKNVAYEVLCKLGGEDEKKLVESIFTKTKHPLKKEDIALELIYANSYMAREYIKNFETIRSFEIFPFLSFREDAALYKKELLERLNDGDDDFLEAYLKITLWYQNPQLIPFYMEMLKYKNLCMQFNELLMRFFYYDDMIEPLEEAIEEWDDFLEEIDEKYEYNSNEYNRSFELESLKVQEYIINFWENKKAYIQETIAMDKRYYLDEYFDILKIWQEAIDDFWPREAIHLHKGIQLLTGEYFAFDINGLLSRQIEQSSDIVSFLKKFKKSHANGEWYVMGKKTEAELRTLTKGKKTPKPEADFFRDKEGGKKNESKSNKIIPDDFFIEE